MTGTRSLAGRVRILGGHSSSVVGAGIQLTGDLVLTCWHVVHDGTEASPPGVLVDTPSHPGTRVAAEVTWSRGVGPAGDGDLAVLRCATPLPSAPATLADRGDDEFDVRIVGFPANTPASVMVLARAVGPVDAGTGWRQLDRISPATAGIDRGFSGSGVYAPDGAVVGMVLARASVGQQLVGWMLPVGQWRALLPPGLLAPALLPSGPLAAVARATRRPAPAPLSFAQKMALARLLEEIPVLRHPDSRQLVIQSLPSHISRMVNPFGPLGLDMFGLIRTGLEYEDGIAALYRVLLLTEGPASRPLRAFRDLAESLGLLTGTEDNR
ncbi:serine protease [Micromonospora sp. PSH03]|uniref:trypsin-like peptidase domain-containing protein n=1 Tax=Micromonospora TaxID=1873 RepID=UPI001B38496B|nr:MULTISPECIES: trypsin-like peptidase domain-containing protein [Micromonospora]MBQ0993597.1 trypsin-like peptidase domain-containing protein [Micromonospora sp. H61]MCG5455254.1 serine protease [Micromonospora salmantinae]